MSISDFAASAYEGLATKLPSTLPTLTAPIGPSNGASVSINDAEAPSIARVSGWFS